MNFIIKEDILGILSEKHSRLEEDFIIMSEKHGEDLKKLRNDITVYEIMKNEKLAMQRLIDELSDEITEYCNRLIEEKKGDKNDTKRN